MKIRATVLTLAIAAGLGTAGNALAVDDPGGRGPRDPAAACERAQSHLEKLQGNQARVQEHIAKLQAKIASGELTEEQLARAQAALAKLQAKLDRITERIGKLQARIAEHCTDPGATGTV